MTQLEESWSAFSTEIAKRYLKSYGHPSIESKVVLTDILLQEARKHPLKLIELGCGNGQLAEYLYERGLNGSYTGVDFSDPLLSAARETFANNPAVTFVKSDVHLLDGLDHDYDFAIYSHVIELLSSPEDALRAAKQVARRIIVRFYEPPEFENTTVELREMDVGGGKVPYIRWKMGRDFYQFVLAKLGAKSVDVYKTASTDQVHVIHFD